MRPPVPVFDTVMSLDADVPTLTEPKPTEAGDTWMRGLPLVAPAWLTTQLRSAIVIVPARVLVEVLAAIE